MTQEEKELLLRDLSARLSYGVKVHIKGEYHKYHDVEEIDISDECVRYFENWHLYEEKITNCRLYLRPMSSMTKEEVGEYISLKEDIVGSDDITYFFETYESIDWLNSHHFDYRGLIEKGLALEAPANMYNVED